MLSLEALCTRNCWFFDMDGTLTVSVHDFAAMRAELGVDPDANTVEAVWALPEPERTEKKRLLDEIGERYVEMTQPQPGAVELLQELRARACRVGLVTRNSRGNTMRTLELLGLEGFFPDNAIATRDDSEPKPSPTALLNMLRGWGESPESALMIGDAVYDLDAGRAAGAATVLIDPEGDSPLRAVADAVVHSPAGLLTALRAGASVHADEAAL